MADIFLSYAREDKAKAERLADALEKQGWSVYWDSRIRAGDYFHREIEREIRLAGCMIVAWSKKSIVSHWVISEATAGLGRNILTPILFESVQPPMPFNVVHTGDLSAWRGEAYAEAFIAICEAIGKRIEPGKKPQHAQGRSRLVGCGRWRM